MRLTSVRLTLQALSHFQVHASEELTTVIDGEALVDDGVAAVLYAVFLVRYLRHVTTHYLCCHAIVHACRHVLYESRMLMQLCNERRCKFTWHVCVSLLSVAKPCSIGYHYHCHDHF